MKQIRRTKAFEKHYRQRITPNKKLQKKFLVAYEQFMVGIRDYPLRDHALTGSMKGLRAFWITADVRVVYAEDENFIVFVDVGTHAQVYC